MLRGLNSRTFLSFFAPEADVRISFCMQDRRHCFLIRHRGVVPGVRRSAWVAPDRSCNPFATHDRKQQLPAPATRDLLGLPYNDGLTPHNELHLGVGQQTGLEPDVDGNGDLAFACNSRDDLLTRVSSAYYFLGQFVSRLRTCRPPAMVRASCEISGFNDRVLRPSRQARGARNRRAVEAVPSDRRRPDSTDPKIRALRAQLNRWPGSRRRSRSALQCDALRLDHGRGRWGG